MTDSPPMDALVAYPGLLREAASRTAELAPSAAIEPLVGEVRSLGAERHYLFVTAPFGPFTRVLARHLREGGAICRRVLLNGGDLVDWGPGAAIAYRNDLAAWPQWIEQVLRRDKVTDLITHGDSHPYAATAIRAAKSLGVSVHVFEQGYLRPHWITLERDGVNAHSSLPRSQEYYAKVASGPSTARPALLGRIIPAAIANISRYHLMVYGLAALFPRYRNPYADAPARQCLGHIRRYAAALRARPANNERLAAIAGKPGPLYLALLQRPGDSQLLRHSPLADCADFITRVIESFAAHAPKDARLLFKAHPLDQGLEPHEAIVAREAAAAGVSERVFFADEGHFETLVARADGVISVNSTGGLAALEAGKPTLALGAAIYDMPGLTHQDGLDLFWTAPAAPDAALFAAYRAVLAARTQINGAFATRRGIALAAPEAARRLLLASAP